LANIRLAVAGIARLCEDAAGAASVLVGRDPRFLGESFVAEAGACWPGRVLRPFVIPEAAPTPHRLRGKPVEDFRRDQLYRLA